MTEEQRILKVLLINDDKMKQQKVIESLAVSDEVYQFDVLDDLDLVRDHLDTSKVDLVITDVEIKGREIFGMMEIYQHLPWVIFSAVKDHQVLRKAYNSGAADYIVGNEQNTILHGLDGTITDILKCWKYQTDSALGDRNFSPENQSTASELHHVNLRLAEESHQRLAALDDLRESREMYRRFFQNSHDAVFISSVDGRWIDMNRSALSLFGYENREDIWTDTMLNFYWDSDQGRDYTRKLETDGFVNDHPIKFRKRDGSSISAQVTAMPYEIGGKVIGYQGLIRDMTDELKAKDENIKLHKDQGIFDSLAREMGSMLELNDIYSSICNHIKEMIVPDWIRILKFSEIQNTFNIEYEWGMNPLGGEGTKELEIFDKNYQSLVEQTSQTKQTTIAGLDESLYQDHKKFQVSVKTPADVEGSEQNPHDSQSIVLTPILINDQVIGIIHVVFDIKKPPDKEDLSFLTRAANIVAISTTIKMESLKQVLITNV